MLNLVPKQSPKIGALAPYYGCKRTMALAIVQQLGPHRCYWEPFCGSAAVLFAKPQVQREIVNDLHRAVINLARVVQDDTLVLHLHNKLARTMTSEELYKDACKVCFIYQESCALEAPPSVDWAYHWLLTSWLGRNGFVGTKQNPQSFAVRYDSGGGDPAVRFRAMVESLPLWWQRLRQITVLCKDGIGLCERIEDKAGTVIYVDPPYFVKTIAYQHDFTASDHQRLAVNLRRFKKTRVVVSYYQQPGLTELYPASLWRVIQVAAQKQLSTSARGAAAPEVLLVNGNIL